MTVAANVAFGLQLRRLSADEIKRRVHEMLTIVRLSDLAGRYPAELSGGQQQRVALARAIVIQPEVLLLDEPLSNLDANLREEMRFEIRRLHDEFRMTTVYVTHDQAEAMVTSDRIVVMNQGAIEQIDTPYELYNAPRTKFVAQFIGRTNFLAATHDGARVDFRGFSLPASYFDRLGDLGPQLLFSLRPQSIKLSASKPGGSEHGEFWVPGKVVTRSYFGDRWDYGIDAGGGITITVSAEPRQEFCVGELAWMAVNPRDMAPIRT
jgi:ABC-type Fe3+/spermidine/putrescine transport system ATPase subunit